MSFEIQDFQHKNDVRGEVLFILDNDGSGYRPFAANDLGISGKTVIYQSTISTLSGVAASASPQTVFSINLERKGFGFYNKASELAYLAYGTGVSINNFTLIVPISGYYEMPASYSSDAISVVWEGSPVGSGFFTELS